MILSKILTTFIFLLVLIQSHAIPDHEFACYFSGDDYAADESKWTLINCTGSDLRSCFFGRIYYEEDNRNHSIKVRDCGSKDLCSSNAGLTDDSPARKFFKQRPAALNIVLKSNCCDFPECNDADKDIRSLSGPLEISIFIRNISGKNGLRNMWIVGFVAIELLCRFSLYL